MLVRRVLWNDIKELVLEQYRESHNFLELLKAVIEQTLQPLEENMFALQNGADIDAASGEWLDILGKLIGTQRRVGESDESYRERLIVFAKKNNAATAPNVIENAVDFSRDPNPQYMDEAPATFFIYTPGGMQLKRDFVQGLAPAGVLGLPGAGIGLANGTLLGTYNDRKVILAVANDANAIQDFALVTHEGDNLITADNRRLVARTYN